MAVPAYVPEYSFGGPVNSVSKAAEGLVKRGHEVDVICCDNEGSKSNAHSRNFVIEYINDVRVLRFKIGSKQPLLKKLAPSYFGQTKGFRYLPELKRYLKMHTQHYDLVHSQTIWSYVNYCCMNYAFETRLPLVINARGELHPNRIAFRRTKVGLLKFALRKYFHRANKFVALTNDEQKFFERQKFRSSSVVIPNGIDLFHEPSKLKMSVKPQRPYILFLSRLHKFKGVEFLVDEYSNFAKENKNVDLVLAGPDEHGLWLNIKNKVVGYGLKDRITYVGCVEGDNKVDLIQGCSLFALVRGEGFSMAILECLAARKPVVISPECSFQDVENYGAGFVVEREHGAWSKTLVSAFDNFAALEEMGQKGGRMVENLYNWKRVIDMIEKMYMDCI